MSANDVPMIQERRLLDRERLILTLAIGIITCIFSIYFAMARGGGAGDLRYTLLPARDWLTGKDPYLPYKTNSDPLAVPYPFTAVLLTVPVSWMADEYAAGIFSGIGAGALAWFIFKRKENWRLLIFLSWPFANSLIFAQWAPYIASMFFTPGLLLFLFVKPQLALPFVLTQKPTQRGIILAAAILAVSIGLYPAWPVDWLGSIHNFIGIPPLFIFPLGPLLLLALTRYRDKRAWLLVLMAVMPQRMVYDQLGVLLVAENRTQQLLLVLCSWISFPLLLFYHGWENIPWGWQNWVLIESYLPALMVVLAPSMKAWNEKVKERKNV
ncbi:MAG: hypothetical protein A2136_00240 [Chloroflexi bacterium RBG_16_54_11]|nr:MAG: hypothetical protein A2136_00240 [Chloroflexi bacterium RBG_16_54_11]